MPRITRGLVNGLVYHILNRGNARQEIFHRDEDYRSFVDLMRKSKERYRISIFAYCLMPNHFHMVTMPAQGQSLSKWMQWLMTSHVRRHHRYYGSTGHVWQGRFKSFPVREDSHLVTVMRYVEANPVRAGFVKTPGDWIWSSHKETLGEKPRLLTDRCPAELPQEWERYVAEPFAEYTLDKLRLSVNRQSPYGDSVWQGEICNKLGLGSTVRPRGRPVKMEWHGRKK